MEVAGPAIERSLISLLSVPLDAVIVIVFAIVGKVYETVARPSESVVTGEGGLKTPPSTFALKLIGIPGTTFPHETITLTAIGAARVVPTVPVCEPPETRVIEAGLPATMVSTKVPDA